MPQKFVELLSYDDANAYAKKFFRPGLIFEISPKPSKSNLKPRKEDIIPIFIFKEKTGVNFIFCHALHKWTRCYTAAQLIGHSIRQVDSI